MCSQLAARSVARAPPSPAVRPERRLKPRPFELGACVTDRFKTGLFIISLDFEMTWGLLGNDRLDDYAANIREAPRVVERLLQLFSDYGVKATWSTVGFLFYDSPAEIAELQTEPPGYQNQKLCPYHYMTRNGTPDQDHHFAPGAVQKILSYPGQEVGSHTFSHLYCREPGIDLQAFRRDLELAAQAAQKHNLDLKSLVFPRNQWRGDFLPALAEAGMTCFRGNEQHWIYQATSRSDQHPLRRALRLLDSYLNLSGHHSFGPDRCGAVPPYDIPASRFLRPWSHRLAAFELLRLRRITRSMKHAAASGQAYHLWWHPHNFGTRTEENLEFLKSICEEYRRLNHLHGFKSATMTEVAQGLRDGSLLP